MKNILKEKPLRKISGRLKFSSEFAEDNDIRNKRVLDIGCGYGWFELNALDRGVKEIVGIEISTEDIKTAKHNIKDKRVIFKISKSRKLPFRNGYFDTVVAWEVIEHIPKNTERDMFEEVRRVLKKNGKFYLSTPYNSFFSTYLDPAWWLAGHRHYSKGKLVLLGKKSKLMAKEICVKGGFWSLLGLLNMYFSKWILRSKSLFLEYYEKKEDKEYKNNDGFIDIFIKYIAN